jgi:ribose 5-phosphate isomerase A
MSAPLVAPASRTEREKVAVGEAAASLVENGMIVGLGTGSTAKAFVAALGRRALKVRCVATSMATAAQAESLGLAVIPLDGAGLIDLTIDGADEIGPRLALIKGGGGALLREKLVWEASARCVVIADSGKRVARLGAYPLPVEVTPFGYETTGRRIMTAVADLGLSGHATWRSHDGGLMRTDSGNLIYDLALGEIPDPAALGSLLKSLTGVVEHGLFLGLAERALIASEGGVATVLP